MNGYDSRLLSREFVAEQTIACRFARPEGFDFRPGQYVDLTVISPAFTDETGPTRSMSIASAPTEPEIELVMRVRDTAFKQSMLALPIGATVLLDGPADDLSLERGADQPRVLIAGGVGIAPFLSLLRDARRTSAPLEAALFSSNRRPEDAASLSELRELSASIPGLRFVPIMTRMSDSATAWDGVVERVSASMLARHLPKLGGRRYYIAGSTGLISALCQDLERHGVSPGNIRIELYTGY
jgi:ferredoxin-NADP reductase